LAIRRSASEELAAQAQSMQAMVSRFKINQTDTASRATPAHAPQQHAPALPEAAPREKETTEF